MSQRISDEDSKESVGVFTASTPRCKSTLPGRFDVCTFVFTVIYETFLTGHIDLIQDRISCPHLGLRETQQVYSSKSEAVRVHWQCNGKTASKRILHQQTLLELRAKPGAYAIRDNPLA